MKLGLAAVVFSSAMIFNAGGCKVYSLEKIKADHAANRRCLLSYACIMENGEPGKPRTSFREDEAVTVVSYWEYCNGLEITSVAKIDGQIKGAINMPKIDEDDDFARLHATYKIGAGIEGRQVEVELWKDRENKITVDFEVAPVNK